MPLATVEDVAARMGQPVSPNDSPRVSAFLDDVTGLIEDYCGRDLDRRTDESLTLYGDGGRVLPIPPRFRTLFQASAVEVEGQAVTGWRYDGQQLVHEDGWPTGPVVVTASWGYPTPPASLRAIACSEAMRWLSVAPGVQSEKVGEVEVTYSGSSSTQTLSALTRAALRPYRRRGVGVMTLRREGPNVALY